MTTTAKSYPTAQFLLLAALCFATSNASPQSVPGIPEPGLFMYGTVATLNGGTPLSNATVSWQVSGGAPLESVTTSATIVKVNGQFFYIARVPFETRALPGSTPLTKTSGTLGLAPAGSPITYTRAATVNGTNATIVAPKTGTFTFGAADRGLVERVDLTAPLAVQPTFAQWLAHYGLPTNSVPDSDPLGKGMTLQEEFIAGTDPTNPNSVFKMETTVKPLVQGGQFAGITIKWDSIDGKSYTVYRSTDLGVSFQPLQSAISATSPFNSFSDSTATGPGPYFYQIQVNP